MLGLLKKKKKSSLASECLQFQFEAVLKKKKKTIKISV